MINLITMKFQYYLKTFINLHYIKHILISLIIRFILIGYGVYHDSVFSVPYTDIDYKVFTDAARHVMNGESPFLRHTYRYSPLLALFLIPNLTLSILFGKIMFCTMDIILALLIRKIVNFNLLEFGEYVKSNKVLSNIEENDSNVLLEISNKKKYRKGKNKLKPPAATDWSVNIADISMLIWLYNPLTIAISTRGNCDSIAGFLVVLTLYFIQCRKKYFLGGIFLGLAIHFRLYPIFYSLTLYMFLSDFSYYVNSNENDENSKMDKIKKSVEEKRTIFNKKYFLYILPNSDQFFLTLGCLASLVFLVGIFYFLYGYQFIYETYLYHFVRHDSRHNFSLYFYIQYLTALIKNVPIWQKVLMSLPQLILLLVISVKYGLDKVSMNFGLLLQTIVMVSYNTVLTSQYFVWIMAVLPLSIWQIRFPSVVALFWILIWFAAQGAWLLPAFLLEFKGQNTFIFIWLQSVAFFAANLAILGRLIMYHNPCNSKVLKNIS